MSGLWSKCFFLFLFHSIWLRGDFGFSLIFISNGSRWIEIEINVDATKWQLLFSNSRRLCVLLVLFGVHSCAIVLIVLRYKDATMNEFIVTCMQRAYSTHRSRIRLSIDSKISNEHLFSAYIFITTTNNFGSGRVYKNPSSAIYLYIFLYSN